MERRKFLLTTSTLAVATAMTTGLSSLPVLAQGRKPIKIGLMAPLTGVVAAGGKEIVEGVELYWQERYMEVARLRVGLNVADDPGNPAAVFQKARCSAEQQAVHLLFGKLSGYTHWAVV